MAEIPFEALLVGLESTRGTAIDPTHYLNAVGTLIPRKERYRPAEQRGTLVQSYRSKKIREWGEFSAEGALDTYTLPVILEMVVKGSVSPTTPGGGTNSRLRQYVPTITSDDLLTGTFYWGDRNVQMFRGAYGHVQELTISNDASGTDGAMMSISGITKGPTYDEFAISAATAANPVVVTLPSGHAIEVGAKVYISDVAGMVELNDTFYLVAATSATTITLDELDGTNLDGSGFTAYTSGGTVRVVAPNFPSFLESPLIVGADMQVWLDTSSAIGTTAITGRVVSAEHVIPVGWVQKYLANGPASAATFTRIARAARQITTRVTMELLDLDQYALFNDDETVKLRVRHNGDLIEGSLYHYVEVDTYGPLHMTDWGELEGVNRTITFEVMSEYDSTLGADFRVAVQNDRASL